MATLEKVGDSASARVRLGVTTLAAVLAIIAISLALSLAVSRSTVTQLHRETVRLRTELGISRSTVSSMKLRALAAHGIEEGPFERVRDHVVAKIAARTPAGT